MPVLELLETTTATTVEEFLAEVTAAIPDVAPEAHDNRPTWDNWSNKK
ncbi:hypothetical protein [Actinocorallia sp. A-T 12471]|nr:hypothetical protein [Actinocorallia sp. A-T 12471]MDX6744140.1 hypothetical protein [Actinocorallia sp. A-T 12471]